MSAVGEMRVAQSKIESLERCIADPGVSIYERILWAKELDYWHRELRCAEGLAREECEEEKGEEVEE
jgi:hypothetical protein